MSRAPAVSRRLCLGVFVFFLAPLHAATWLKLQTEDVVVYSDAPQSEVVDFAVGYAGFRHAFRTMFSPDAPPAPTTIILFRTLKALRDYIPKPEAKGLAAVCFKAELDDNALIALSAQGSRTRALETVFQFDTGWELQRAGYRLPLWMMQGVCEVMASLELNGSSCRVGKGVSWFSSGWQTSVRMPWPKFFAVNQQSPEYNPAEADGLYHMQAWALMHRVLLDGENGRMNFEALFEKLRDTPDSEAVQAVLHVSEDQLKEDIHRHFARGSFVREIPFDATAARRRIAIDSASDAERQVQLGNLLFAAGKSDEAESEWAKAAGVESMAVPLKEAHARYALHENDRTTAVQLYREAIAAGSKNAAAYLISAQQRLDESHDGVERAGVGGALAEQAAAEIRRALGLSPGNPEAYQLLGRALYLSPNIAAADVEDLRRGIARSESGARVQYYRALLYQRLGRTAEYVADLRAVADNPLAPSLLRDAARKAAGIPDFDQLVATVEALTQKQQFEAALAAVDGYRTLAAAADNNRYAQLRDWIVQKQAWTNIQSLHTAHRWPELASAAKLFLEQYPAGQAAPYVRNYLQEAATAIERAN